MIRVLHWGLMATLLGEALYCWYQVMVVLQPVGMAGPMFGHAGRCPSSCWLRGGCTPSKGGSRSWGWPCTSA